MFRTVQETAAGRVRQTSRAPGNISWKTSRRVGYLRKSTWVMSALTTASTPVRTSALWARSPSFSPSIKVHSIATLRTHCVR